MHGRGGMGAPALGRAGLNGRLGGPESGKQRGLLAAAVVDAKGAANLLEPVAGEVREQLSERRGLLDEALDEVSLLPAVTDDDAMAIDETEELLAGEVFEDLALRGHGAREDTSAYWERGARS